MRKQLLLNVFAVGLVVMLAQTNAMAQFTLTGELRPRTEYRNGFKKLREASTDPAFFIEQRSRIYMDFKKEKIWMNIALQDVRMWGSTDQIYKEDPTLQNVYEAWAKYSFNEKYAFKVGRQAMNYDNARFMGNLDWAQQGRSHDVIIFMREDSERNCKTHLAFGYNQQIPFEPGKLSGTDYLGVKNYKTLLLGWWTRKFDKSEVSVLFHNDGQQTADTTIANRQTYGVLGNYNLGGFKLDGEFYYQGGKNKRETKVNAFLIAVHGTITTDITPVILGVEYLSGTSLADDKDHSFDPLYGTNHKFYGFMDYFYVGNYHGQVGGSTSGLIDLHVKTKFKLGQKSNLAANLHYFASPAKIYKTADTNGDTYGSGLGTEIDLVYTVALTKDVKFNLGYSQMFATETMEAVKDGGDKSAMQNWAWAMIAFKPQLFSSAKD
jgi:hypothetical protein